MNLNAVGSTGTAVATVVPANATNKNVTWTSSATGVATVSSTGVVTPVSSGTTNISVTTVDGGFTVTCVVTVTNQPVAVTGVSVQPTTMNLNAGGSTGTVVATVVPANATNKNVTWSSSDPGVATVSSTGVVTSVSSGTANITVTTVDGSNIAICVVKVEITIPAKPILLAPLDNSTNLTINPTLSWNSISGASSYRLQVSLSSVFSTTIIDQSNIIYTSLSLTNLSNNTLYYWRVNATNISGTSDWSDIWKFTSDIGTFVEPVVSNSSIILKQNYPNPFTQLTTIEFYIPKPSQVEINIYDVIGIKMTNLFNGYLELGLHTVEWIPQYVLKSGIYYYQLRTNDYVKTKFMIYKK
jgi:hypothetical protein